MLVEVKVSLLLIDPKNILIVFCSEVNWIVVIFWLSNQLPPYASWRLGNDPGYSVIDLKTCTDLYNIREDFGNKRAGDIFQFFLNALRLLLISEH